MIKFFSNQYFFVLSLQLNKELDEMMKLLDKKKNKEAFMIYERM